MLQDVIFKYLGKHFTFEDVFDGPEEIDPKFLVRKRRKRKITFVIAMYGLKMLPYLCLVGFAISFFPFSHILYTFEFLGKTVDFDDILRIISVGGLIGYGTNYIAIKMLFKPVMRRPIWGQGLIPSQKDRIIGQLAGGIHRFILSEEMIKTRIHESRIIQRLNTSLIQSLHELLRDKEFIEEIKTFTNEYLKEILQKEGIRDRFSGHIDTHLEENLNQGFKGFLFKTYKRLNKDDYEAVLNNLVENIPGTITSALAEMEHNADELKTYLEEKSADNEEIILNLIMDLLDRVDIQKMLIGQMKDFDESRIEQMIYNATSDQLQYIQLLGSFLGILGGLLIWAPELIGIIYLAAFSLLFLTDIILFNFAKKKI